MPSPASRPFPAWLALAAALVLLVSACDDVTTPALVGVDPTGSWQLEEGTFQGEPIPLVDTHRITLDVTPGDGRGAAVAGTSACNHYGGELELGVDTLRIGDVFSTAMGCEPAEVMESEQRYLAALGAVDTMERNGDRLVLTSSGADTELRFVALPAIEPEALVDTEWVLQSLIEGDTAASSAGEPATLLITSDGRIEGSTGCRTLSGGYVLGGDSVTVTELTADGECPADLAAQDAHVVTVIGDGFTPRIDGDNLFLESTGGLGLSYRRS